MNKTTIVISHDVASLHQVIDALVQCKAIIKNVKDTVVVEIENTQLQRAVAGLGLMGYLKK